MSIEVVCDNDPCKSKSHALEMCSAVSKGNLNQIKLYLKSCNNPIYNTDEFGRTVLHVAATCGKLDIINWLIDEVGSEVNVKDNESNWTALHKAIYYRQLDAAISLIENGANIYSKDKDGLTPIDLAHLDCISSNCNIDEYTESTETDKLLAFSWGNNYNMNLGHENGKDRRLPDCIDFFPASGIHLKHVSMNEFHTMFLSSGGIVYTCGHGQKGRLGLGDELTYVKPQRVNYLKDKLCISVIASRDHSIFLTSDGTVYTCGDNSSGQLGHNCEKSLLPTLVKSLKKHEIIGIEGGKYHSIVWNENNIWSWGLNIGQLGQSRPQKDNKITKPTLITSLLCENGSRIEGVKSSEAGTIISRIKYDNILEFWVLYNFKILRIFSRQVSPTKRPLLELQKHIAIGGENLPKHINKQNQERPIEEFYCVFSVPTDKYEIYDIYLWRSSGILQKCIWPLKYNVNFKQCFIGGKFLYFLTTTNELFSSKFIGKSFEKSNKTNKETLELTFEKISHVFRAKYFVCDAKAKNFCILQTDSKLKYKPRNREFVNSNDFSYMLENAEEFAPDLQLTVNSRKFSVHKFILCSRSKWFLEKLTNDTISEISMPDNVTYKVFEDLLRLIYSGYCKKLPNNDKKFLEAGKFYGVKRLESCKKAVDICSQTLPHLQRQSLPQFYDIEISCPDGITFGCHKCILMAKSEYFHAMFSSDWLESKNELIELPEDSQVVMIVLDSFYNDNMLSRSENMTMELVCQVLCLAEQLLFDALKRRCESVLVSFSEIFFISICIPHL
ncbi:DgyrCDS11610 [Dimorphilus gyrociliatus]|uniref:DgyrCDS11610 n=1 Tax=Dimorphilus gyrociliatus TaxID=2664684 RepID=A0A7I8W3V9_9ANNE|nr:DgyrCDS11610 [Dimorphilus gyrociliatus]